MLRGGLSTTEKLLTILAAGATIAGFVLGLRNDTVREVVGIDKKTKTEEKSSARPARTPSAPSIRLTSLVDRMVTPNVSADVMSGRVLGTPYRDALGISLSTISRDETGWRLEVPVDERMTEVRGVFGISSDDPSTTSVRLEVHADTAEGPVLYERDFSSPADADPKVSFETAGATKLVLMFDSELDQFEYGTAHFVIAEGKLVGT